MGKELKPGELSRLAREAGIAIGVVWGRLQRGWSLEGALGPVEPGSGCAKGSISEQARAAGLKPATVIARLDAGWTMTDALSISLNARRSPPKVSEVSRRALAAGISPEVVHKRINRGWSEADALSAPLGHHRPRQKKLKLSKDAAASGIPYHLVKKRLERGWSKVDALSLPVGTRHKPHKCFSTNPDTRKRFIYDNMRRKIAADLLGKKVTLREAKKLLQALKLAGIKRRLTDKDIAETAGIKYGTFRYRKSRGLPIEAPLKTGRNAASLNGRARAAGLSTGLVHSRVKVLGWSEARALSTPILAPAERAALSYKERWGKTKTLAKKSRQAGLRYGLVWSRIHRHGWSEKRALSTPPLN